MGIGGSITTMLKWSPDPDDVEAALVSIAGHIERLEAPLRASSLVARRDIQNNFDTESDPAGVPWIPLNEKYLKWKEGQGYDNRILRMTGDLEEAATDTTAFVIDHNNGNLYYNASNLPPYWELHQSGRPLGNTGGESFSKSAAKVLGFADEGGGEGAGNNIPQRSFIGISAEAEEKIFNIFDIWFFEGMQVKVSSAGVLQHAPGGRFGSPVDI